MVKAIINIPDDFCNPLSEYSSNAANLSPTERKAISVEALAGSSTVTEIAARNNVSRKFAHKQKNIANILSFACLNFGFSSFGCNYPIFHFGQF